MADLFDLRRRHAGPSKQFGDLRIVSHPIDLCWSAVDAVQISPQAHTVLAAHVDNVLHVVRQQAKRRTGNAHEKSRNGAFGLLKGPLPRPHRTQGSLAVVLLLSEESWRQEAGEQIDTHDASAVRHRPYHLVGEIPRVWAEGSTVAVAGDERLRTDGADIPERLVGGVRDIDHHPQFIAHPDELSPLVRESQASAAAGAAVWVDGGAAERVVRPSQGEKPNSRMVEGKEGLGVALQRISALQAADGCDLAGTGAGGLDIAPGSSQNKPIGMLATKTTHSLDHLHGHLIFPAVQALGECPSGEDLAHIPALSIPGKVTCIPSVAAKSAPFSSTL